MSEQADGADRRKPGRPRQDGDLQEAILDAAERAFADLGFSGAKIRDIATGAGVNPGLIRYYFGSKSDLFDEVFRRRGGVVAGSRHVLLDRLLEECPAPSVEQIIRAYLKPQWDIKHSGEGGAAFVRLQARLHAEPEEHALRLRREVYDASVRRYVSALADVLPEIPRGTISLRMTFLVGTYMFMLNDLGRLSDMTDGQIAALDMGEMLDELVRFLAAGLRAPLVE